MTDKTGRLLAVMANPLLRKKLTLGTLEQHLLHMALAQIPDPRDESADLPVFEVGVTQYAELTGRSARQGSLYRDIRSAVQKLQATKVCLDGGREVAVLAPWARYPEGAGRLQFRIEQSLKPYVLGLRRHFGKVPVAEACKLRSGYAISFYLYCWSWRQSAHRGWEMTVAEVRDWLSIAPGVFERPCDLKRRAIDQARWELDKKASLTFTAQPQRDGKALLGWRFEIKENQKHLARAERARRRLRKTAVPEPAEDSPEQKARTLAGLAQFKTQLKAQAVALA